MFLFKYISIIYSAITLTFNKWFEVQQLLFLGYICGENHELAITLLKEKFNRIEAILWRSPFMLIVEFLQPVTSSSAFTNVNMLQRVATRSSSSAFTNVNMLQRVATRFFGVFVTNLSLPVVVHLRSPKLVGHLECQLMFKSF